MSGSIHASLKLLICAIMLFANSRVFSQYIEPYSSEKLLKNYDNAVASTKSVGVEDEPGYTEETGFRDAEVINYVKVYFDKNIPSYFTSAFEVEVNLQIKKYPTGGGAAIDDDETITVYFDPSNANPSKDIGIFTFENYYKVKATIQSLKINGTTVTSGSTLPANLKLGTGIRIERYMDFSVGDAPTGLKVEYVEEIDAYRIKNFEVDGGLYYDIEYTFVDDYVESSLAGEIAAADLNFRFKNNATRIQVSPGTKVYIPNVFDRGYLIVRARAIGPSNFDVNVLVEGNWSLNDAYDDGDGLFATKTLSGISTDYFIQVNSADDITAPNQHFAGMSWIVQTTFAEDGKMKHVVQYMDATGRVRQTATMSNTEKEALLTETIYDKHGRAVFQSLPAPAPIVATPVDGYRSKLEYVSGFNQTTAVSPVIYDKSAFDIDMEYCTVEIPAVGESIGAGQYYSENNPKKNNYHAYIPDAKGYPFVYTQFTPDNTGRIKKQSGVGETHKIGSSHEIQYLYGTPDQEELDRLFGKNVGLAQHYFKTAIIDPNDQVSVSYTDMDGHVVATALAGPSASNLDPLMVGEETAYDAAMQVIEVDILEKTGAEPQGLNNFLSPDGLTLEAKDVFIVAEETEYHFVYTAEGYNYLATCLTDRCFECVYDLTISLTDDCGTQYLNTASGGLFTHTLGTIPVLGASPATTCEVASYNSESADDLIFTVVLPRGSYTLTKTISISEEAANINAANYIATLEATNPECFTSLEETLALIDEFELDCELDCDYCNTLPTFPEFLTAEVGAGNEPIALDPEYIFYENIYNEMEQLCAEICPEDIMDPCTAGLNAMLADLSPGGQYAQYKIDADDIYTAADYPLSIFNYGNLKLDRSITTTPDYPEAAYYKNPITLVDGNWQNGYYSFSERVLIDLSAFAAIDPSLSEVNDGGPLTYSDVDGDGVFETVYGYPEHLTLKYFIQLFQPEWAYGLLLYHPEYYYYEACLNYSDCTADITPAAGGTAVPKTTFGFDEMLFGYSYLDIATSTDYKRPYTIDPLFDDGTCEIPELSYTEFVNDYLIDYAYCEMDPAADIDLNIYQMVYLAMHGGTGDICADLPEALEDYEDFEDPSAISVINSTEAWVYFVGFYKSAKTKYLNALSHEYAQEELSINLSIGTDDFWPPVIETLSLLGVSDPWDEVTTNANYLPYITRTALLHTNGIRFPDINWHNGFNPNSPINDPELLAAAEEAAADLDYIYFTTTGNLAMALDFENFLNYVVDYAEVSALNWRTDNINVSDIPGTSERLLNAFEERCLNVWDAAISTVTNTSDKLTWNPTGGCTPTEDCDDNYIILDASAYPTISSGWNEELVGFYDIQTDAATGDFTVTVVFLITGEEVHVTATGKSCIPFDLPSYQQTHCDLTPEASAMWSLLNYLVENTALNASIDIDEVLISPVLKTYLGPEPTGGEYTWTSLGGGEYILENPDAPNAIHLLMTTGVDLTGTLNIDYFEPFPEIGAAPEDYPTVTGYIDMFKLSQNGGASYKSGTIKYSDTEPVDGYVYQSFPVASCGHDVFLEAPCDEPEHFSAFDLNDLFVELLGSGTPIVEETYIPLDGATTYPGWTTHLSNMMGGSDLENDEFLYIDSYTGSTLEMTFKTETAADVYVDLCHVTLNITDPLITLELDELSSSLMLIPHAALAEPDGIHDFTIECPEEAGCVGDELNFIAWGHIDCLTLKGCPCPDRSNNGSFYYDVETNIELGGGGGTGIGVTGVHPLTGVADAATLSFGLSTKPIKLDYKSYLKSGKIVLLDTIPLKLQLYAFGKNALIDTIWADSTADTITVYLRLDGYNEEYTARQTGFSDCDVNVIATPVIPYIDPCLQDQIDVAINNAHAIYEAYIEELTNTFVSEYLQQCIGNLTESFDKDYSSSEYHYTLYYYDQAGNLTMTVPPQGVDFLDATAMGTMETYRTTGTGSGAEPNHQLTSRYRYNSLNQLSMQTTPDAGVSRFWYDALGRIVLSQNAKQAHDGETGIDYMEFSYTRFDELGRIYEVGELNMDETDVSDAIIADAIVNQETLFTDLINIGTRSEVTSTYYNKPFDLTGDPFGADGQVNQRNRISAVTIEIDFDDIPETYDHATHYTYDIHGNVFTMIQDNPNLGDIQAEEQFKRIDYQYDLISGNVEEVAFQNDKADQFYHRYQYDADNRIYEVQTSRDGWIWEKEARYFYYRHGPLARVETGDLMVQGTDYAYTIQGWLKGVNAGALIADRDMGKDGYDDAGNTNKFIAQDAFGFVLSYFDEDYNQINTGAAYKFLPNVSASNYNGIANSLYNGNIMAMSTALLKPLEAADADGHHDKADVLGKVYTYDQLNRITSSSSYEKAMTSAATFTWSGGGGGPTYATDKWNTSYTYDGNGNILTMNRAGNLGGVHDMDQLSYQYISGTNQLLRVDDAIEPVAPATEPYSVDVKDQDGTNYTYDKIGNLITDVAEGIENIEWTVYGKIKSINKTAGPDLEFEYDATGNRISKKVIPATGDVITTYYVRDAQGNVMAVYTHVASNTPTFDLSEQHIYGSSRIGMVQTTINMLATFTEDSYFYRVLGEKRYELSNHLGNVLSVISDRRTAFESATAGISAYYEPEVISAQDYDPFGMLLVGRTFDVNYRYGFNGKEFDADPYGQGNVYDYGFRIYNPRIGKFLSVDPLTKSYPWYTPYQFSGNSPIFAVDLDGLELKTVILWIDVEGNQKTEVYVLNGATNSDGNAQTDVYYYFHRNLDGENVTIELNHYTIVEPVSKNGMKPSASYDYTEVAIAGKDEDDQDYITNGIEGTPGSRMLELMERDLGAPDFDPQVYQDAILTAITYVPFGKWLSPVVVSEVRFLNHADFDQIPKTGTINAQKIRFSQKDIKWEFKDNMGSVEDMITKLKNGDLKASDIKPIEIVERNGKVYSLDNRRLYAFQQAGIEIRYKKVRWKNKYQGKFTTENEGTSIEIRPKLE